MIRKIFWNLVEEKVEKRLKVRGLKYAKIGESNPDLIREFIAKVKPYQTNHSLIRIGPQKDGGYLLPDDLEGIGTCFSAGVGNEFGFEMDCYSRSMKIFMADKSIERPINIPSDFQFLPKFIGPFCDRDFITMKEWVKKSLPKSNSDLLLQMDIESGEYFSILNMSDELIQRFRIIVIEFHGFRKLWNPDFLNLANTTCKKLLQHHTCVHIHPNNASGIYEINNIPIPRTMEFTFLRNDRITEQMPISNFPHHLDVDNVNRKPSITLPEIWYK